MKTNKFLALMLSMACAIGFYSCSDDDGPKPALQDPEVTETAAAYNSLSFEWSDVPNAVQYGYQLFDSEGNALQSGVTHDKSVTITGLKPATTYTLKVWAFASMDGDYSTPPAVSLTATTDPLIKLATPQNLQLEAQNEYTYTATWDAVENATDYVWTIRATDGTLASTDTITTTKASIKNLADGDYIFSVYAAAHDGYDTSDSASAEFNILNPTAPLYTVTGTYYSAQLNKSWPATMVANADGTYSILAFYGVEGYNLDFKVNEDDTDDMFEILNGEYVYDETVGYYSWQVPTGLSNPSMLITYPWYNYGGFEGDANEGEVYIYTYWNNYSDGDYDEFTWSSSGSGSGTISSVDDLTGTYDCHFTGWDYYLTGSGETTWDDTWTDYATITKVNNTTVSIDGLFWTEEPVEGVVNFANMTITLEVKSDYCSWYTLASIENYDVPVVATISADGTVTVADWALWYNYGTDASPEWYTYLEGTSVLTKSSAKSMRKMAVPVQTKAKKAMRKSTSKAAPKKAATTRKPVHKPIR